MRRSEYLRPTMRNTGCTVPSRRIPIPGTRRRRGRRRRRSAGRLQPAGAAGALVMISPAPGGKHEGMATILVTGSSDGIGRQTASTLAADGHRVVVHARNEQRAAQARTAVPEAAAVVHGDLASLAETRGLAEQAAAVGPYDVVIHNAGIGGGQREPVRTGDGLERIFQVNVLAPYVRTALVPWPARLVYLTSGLESG